MTTKKNRLTMTVSFQVDEAQALALQAMFQYWTFLGKAGSSRRVSFYVDGHGNFKPNCTFQFSQPIRELTDEIRQRTVNSEDVRGNRIYDFDGLYSFLRAKEDTPQPPDFEQLKLANNPNNEPTGPFTGRCGKCGSKDLWNDGMVYGCKCCKAIFSN